MDILLIGLLLLIPITSTIRWCYIVGMFDGRDPGFGLIFAALFLVMSPIAGWALLPTVLIELFQKKPV